MAMYRTVAASAAAAVVLALSGTASAETALPKAPAAQAALVTGSQKTLQFFAGGMKASKKRRAEVAQFAATPAGGAAASVAPQTNFLQLGLVAVGAAAAGSAGAIAAQGSSASN